MRSRRFVGPIGRRKRRDILTTDQSDALAPIRRTVTVSRTLRRAYGPCALFPVSYTHLTLPTILLV
eukprot:3710260-Pyramimonas_sp.AAC.1